MAESPLAAVGQGQSPVGAASPQGQPQAVPGSSPVTMPTPNRGLQAMGLAQLQVAVRIIERTLPIFGVGTEVGKDVMNALRTLSKHVPAGSGTSGVENTALMGLMNQQRQDAPTISTLRAMQAGGSPSGAAGAGGPAQAA